jgi:hypothetical protein
MHPIPATNTDTVADRPSAAEIAQRFPEAVAFARSMREVFGHETRLIYARNPAGETLGNPTV